MRRRHRHGWVGAALLAGLVGLSTPHLASAQFISTGSFDLSGPVLLDECDNATRANLERVRAYLDDAQWDDAVETLRQVMETGGDRVIRLSDGRNVSVRTHCQMILAGLYPDRREALALYRQRVDTQARQWYESGIASRNVEQLKKVISQAYCSSWGDQALFALGELALERGDPSAARDDWEQLDPTWRGDDGRPLWLALRDGKGPVATTGAPGARRVVESSAPRRLAYPDTDIDLAEIRARLVLASIQEGSLERARLELSHFSKLHAEAQGHLAGHDGRYVDLLAGMLRDAATWPAPAAPRDWLTFGGSPDRNHVAPEAFVMGRLQWHSSPIGDPLRADSAVATQVGLPQLRVAEDKDALLSYHPIVVGDVLLYNSQRQVFALDLQTGRPHWPGLEKGGQDSGAIYTEPDTPSDGKRILLGVPRFTLTCSGSLVYARLGSPITTRQSDSITNDTGALVCLDLRTQGGLVNRITPEDKWAFEGTPVCDGNNVYVAMRYTDVRPQSHVACYDARLGRLRWRRLICSSETIGRGQIDEATENLLTLAGDTLLVNTNLGAVAALSAADGQVKWVTLYPRAKTGDLSARGAHFFRDLNPCLYYKGLVIAAPSDSEDIFALDAFTGEPVWHTAPGVAVDAVHLLGVAADRLLASGDQLWWIDVHTGKYLARWPEQPASGLRPMGRGVLAGDAVYWPLQSKIEVFSQSTAAPQKEILLNVPNVDAKAGNLVAAGDYLVIAADTRLFVLGPTAAPTREAATSRPH